MHLSKKISRRDYLKYSLGLMLWSAALALKKTTTKTYGLNFLMGRDPTPFVSKSGCRLMPEAMQAFEKMQKVAAHDGIKLVVVSSFRPFSRQLQIWNNKLTLFKNKYGDEGKAIQEILKYSSIPGTSRHHWGTEVDIIQQNAGQKSLHVGDPLREELFQQGGVFYPLRQWLDENAHKFNFYETYTKDASRTGFRYEPWHFSYRPLSRYMLQDFLEYDVYGRLKELAVPGLAFLTRAEFHDYLKKYMLGINNILW